jgi:S1-C subfamily serine protease
MRFGFSTVVLAIILCLSGCDGDRPRQSSPAPASSESVPAAPPPVSVAPSPKDLARGDPVSDTAAHFDLGTAQKLGIKVKDNLDPPGMLIVAVEENSEAKKAGLESNDIVTKLNDEVIRSADDFNKKYEVMSRKVSFEIQYWRGGKAYEGNIITP